MNEKVENQGNSGDAIKWIVVALLAIGGVVGYYYFSDQLLPVRILGLAVALGLACFVAATTTKGRGFISFYKAADIERRKVVWPTRQETMQTTIVVLVVVVLIGLFIWGLDFIFSNIVEWLVAPSSGA